MTDHDLNATQLARATQILRTYEQRAFPSGGSLLDRDPLYARALLGALIGDLEHYAANHGLDFTEVISSGHAAAPHKVGDEVRLPRQHGRCGTIVGWTNSRSDTETTYLVEIPGIPRVLAEPAAHLLSAPPFPRTDTSLGTVLHADQAERTYISLTARLVTAEAADRPVLERDRDKLIMALSSWSGVPAHQLRDELDPKPPPDAPAARSRDAATASDDFPHDITKGIPTTPARPADRPAKQANPRRGPAQAA
ncbi:MAG TPA: hypothetical protein VFV01_01705 [Spirillospora sp.]|nr:hypothetical protein [Spirillospora sp.]